MMNKFLKTASEDSILQWCHTKDLEWLAQKGDITFNNVKYGDEIEFRVEPEWFPDGADVLGSSGWNPIDLVSEFGGADFDDLSHSEGLGKKHINSIIKACRAVPWLQIQRSKGGGGFHLYWRFAPGIRATNRAEHKRNCLRVLRKIEELTGLSLIDDALDCAGRILFFYVAKPKPNSFKIEQVAKGHAPADLPEPPEPKWKAPKVDVDATEFDDEHRDIIDAWSQSGYSVTTDTVNAQPIVRLHVKAAESGPDKSYRTESKGTRPNSLHAYAYPLKGGGFLLIQWGEKTDCAPWFKSSKGNLCCLYNVRDIEQRARQTLPYYDGAFIGTVGQIASVLPERIDVVGIEDRHARLEVKSGRWVIAFVDKKNTPLPTGWHKPKSTALYFLEAAVSEDESTEFPQVYELIGEATEDGAEAGDYLLMHEGTPEFFTERRLERHLSKNGLRDHTQKIKDSAITLRKRTAHLRPTRIENGWFNVGARLKVEPSPGDHPTWDLIDEHIGQTLTPHLDHWCKESGIETGGQFLRLWRSVAFQHPDHPTPFLSLYSKGQGTGKTTWADGLKFLVEGGIAGATGMLRKNSNFNAHVTRAWYATIRESDISADGVYDTLKGLITDPDAESEAKFQQSTLVKNCCHFVQTSNHLRYCPLGESGDRRIIVVRVPVLKDQILKREMTERLEAEAPAYLWTLLHTPLPPEASPLWLPILNTPERRLLIELRTSPVNRFISERVEEVPYERIPAAEFADSLQQWYTDTMGKGHTIGKQEIYAELRSQESAITYVADHHQAYVANARWKLVDTLKPSGESQPASVSVSA